MTEPTPDPAAVNGSRPPSTGEPAPRRADFRFAERLRVRWAEVDPQNIVFNGHYLMYLDTASAGYWRALAMPYAETFNDLGGELFVRRATVEYAAAAHYDEQIEVGLRCASIGRSSLRFAAGVFRAGRLLVTGELIYVFADPSRTHSLPVPDALRQVIGAFEAGEPCVSVEVGPWATLGAQVQAVRQRACEGDADGDAVSPGLMPGDANAWHAVARNRFGLPVATARLVPLDANRGCLDGLVVHPLLRGARLGRQVVDAIGAAARGQGLRVLLASVPADAVGFFARLGFVDPAPSDVPHPVLIDPRPDAQLLMRAL